MYNTIQKELELKNLIPTEGNPQSMDDKTFTGLVKSMRRKGWYMECPTIWSRPDGQYQIISGHHRIKAGIAAGLISTVCNIIYDIDYTSEQAVKDCIEANGRKGEFDDNKLRDLLNNLGDISTNTDDLSDELGINCDAILGMIDCDNNNPADDAVPDTDDAAIITKPGDVYQLGRHRLMCGNSAHIEDVNLLMDGHKCDMVFTDPPYGASIGDKNKLLDTISQAGRITSNIVNDTLPLDKLQIVLTQAFTNLKLVSNSVCSYYVTAPQGGDFGMMMLSMMKDAGLPVRHIIIWVKNRQCFSFGMLDYEYKHEPILYTWNKSHKFYGKGAHKSSVWEIDKELKCDKHPTMKPIELMTNAIINSTLTGNLVVDMFLGSGSTLIACEKTNRVCYGMEIDPYYCDVIVSRYCTYVNNNNVIINGAGIEWTHQQ
jgi:DNA modification methylase